MPRVTRRFEKKLPNFSKSSPNRLHDKKAKISTTKLNLKAQNIYIKQTTFKTLKYQQQTMF
jgi:hypothetical protein